MTRRTAIPIFFILCWALLFGLSISAQTFDAKVVGVTDGDTITVLAEDSSIRIRLAEIDCPESRQPWGTRAKQFTATLVFGRTVTVVPQSTDRYSRTLAHVRITDNGTDLNTELVRAGLAWGYRQYSRSRLLETAEEEARRARRGLWADPRPVPPWEWRRTAAR